jgi:Protein of unknown function (DUF2778)
MWFWDQSEGKLTHNSKFVSRGYSGYGIGKNNPDLEAKVATGPIPCGEWKILAPRNRPQTVGPYAMPLEPVGHNARGRSAFMIHGDSAKAPGKASHGCIILPRNVRELIWNSGDHKLIVVE